MDKVTELSEIGRQLSELEKQRKQAHQRASQDGNWTEDTRLQEKIAELMERRNQLNKI
ncbi:MAG TPA: hypothetical protein VNN81_05200 [Bradyrhizobium sp.]|nr:hypothetical protein [Bradyrhizobium sp.]